MRPLVPALLSVLGLSLLAGCGGNSTVTKKEVEIGYLGKARYNHFLAAARYLEGCGIPAKSVPSLPEIPHTDTLLLLPASLTKSEGMANSLSDWVHRGGHLIVVKGRMPRAASWYIEDRNNLFFKFGNKNDDEEDPAADLLEHFDISIVEENEDFEEDDVVVHGERYRLGTSNSSTFSVKRFPRGTYSNGRAEGSSFLSLPEGRGRFTLLSDPTPFVNRYIGEEDHAPLLWKVANINNPSKAVFVYGSGVSFWGLLFKHGWMPLLGLLLLTILWIARNAPRFGPLMAPVPDASRQFREHITASGLSLWRADACVELLGPLRRQVQKKLLKNNLSRESAAETAGIPLATVIDALDLDTQDPVAFTEKIQTLQTLDKAL